MICTAKRIGQSREYNEDGTYFNASLKNHTVFEKKMDNVTVTFNSTREWYDMINEKIWHEE